MIFAAAVTVFFCGRRGRQRVIEFGFLKNARSKIEPGKSESPKRAIIESRSKMLRGSERHLEKRRAKPKSEKLLSEILTGIRVISVT